MLCRARGCVRVPPRLHRSDGEATAAWTLSLSHVIERKRFARNPVRVLPDDLEGRGRRTADLPAGDRCSDQLVAAWLELAPGQPAGEVKAVGASETGECEGASQRDQPRAFVSSMV